MYYLDKGMLNHYAQLYDKSSLFLEDAERAIEDSFTKSVSQEISTYLVNDNARDYPGEDYEDIYINAFNTLNYYHRGENEGAMVEIRRMNNKLANLGHKYDVALTNLQKKALEENKNQLPPNLNAPPQFSDSALARYLGILFYRGDGLLDDARIDREYLLAAFANSPSIYKHPVPQSIYDELEIPGDMSRLNIIAFGGLSPVKKETVIRIPMLDGHWIKIAYPEMVSRYSDIGRVILKLDNGGSYELELLENIDAVAKETFKLRQQLIYLKTAIRAFMKAASSSVLNAAAKETSGEHSLVLSLFSLTTQIYAEASERADIRISRFFPATAFVTGINLPEGIYSFDIKYYNRQGMEIASVRHENMEVSQNTLNLAEAVCLK